MRYRHGIGRVYPVRLAQTRGRDLMFPDTGHNFTIGDHIAENE